MTVQPIGSNQTVVVKKIHDVTYTFLISYRTPVAIMMNTEPTVFVTSTHYSSTTNKHIDKWVGDNERKSMKQSDIDFLFNMSE